MAKAASPIRLEKSLMQAAAIAGASLHRSSAEQVEYWADIGRKMAAIVDPEVLLAVKAGLATIRVEKVEPPALDVDAVFDAFDNDRQSGALSQAIAAGGVRYQASHTQPGLLDACYPDGCIECGQFIDGVFTVSATK